MRQLATYGMHTQMCRTSTQRGDRQSLRFLIACGLIAIAVGIAPNQTYHVFLSQAISADKVAIITALFFCFFAGLILFGALSRFAAAVMMIVALAAICTAITHDWQAYSTGRFVFDVTIFVGLALCAREHPSAGKQKYNSELAQAYHTPLSDRARRHTPARKLHLSPTYSSSAGNPSNGDDLNRLFDQLREHM